MNRPPPGGGRRAVIRLVIALPLIYLAWELLTIPYFSIARLSVVNPEETALMRQRLDEARDRNENLSVVRQWVPIRKIPSFTLKAIVVAEDGLFFSHGGLDWYEIQESLKKNLEKGEAARGASTISQQLAKNLYLSTSKTPLRKLKEVIITFLLESHLSKTRILELYVNVIEWGKGIFGIEAAAQRYFGKSAADLTLDESIRLAAVIPSPLRFRPDRDSRYVTRRKEIVFRRMEARGDLPRLSGN